MQTDPGLIWTQDPLRFKDYPDLDDKTRAALQALDPTRQFDRRIAHGWRKWFAGGGGEAEWNKVQSGGQLAQEVKKTHVTLGIYRQNRGFQPGQRYRASFQARPLAAGQGTIPRAAVWIHTPGAVSYPRDGDLTHDPLDGEWQRGPWQALSITDRWSEVSLEFEARARVQTIFLAVDLSQGRDRAVWLSGVEVTCGAGNPGLSLPWMQNGRPPVEPAYIYGLHDGGAEHLLTRKGRQGWFVHALAIGADPHDRTGHRFSEWVDGHGVIVRLSNDFTGGDIPRDPARYDDFAACCANFVANSIGAGIWSIGNETPAESGATPAQYAACFCKCRTAIQCVRSGAQVITGGMMHGRPEYFRDTIREIQRIQAAGDSPCGRGDLGVDGFAIHSCASQKFNQSQFREYRALLAQIPEAMQDLPIYMTEADQGPTGRPYPNQNNGLLNDMYADVHAWNQDRYPTETADNDGIEYTPCMIEDLLGALENEYYWRQS